MNKFERQREIAKRLGPVAGEDAFLEAGFLIEYCKIHIGSDIEELISRRLTGEPMQYVLGEWDFMGLTFHTDKRALIPRPDTEKVCEIALEKIQIGNRVLDLCCGSGCIGISIARRKNIQLVSADLSAQALELTKENAELNNVTLELVLSDLFEKIEGTFDCIICNPPYLNAKEMQEIDSSLRFEPEMALYGGNDGLDFYQRIREVYKQFLNPDGWLIMEIGYSQAEASVAVSKLSPDLSVEELIKAALKNMTLRF